MSKPVLIEYRRDADGYGNGERFVIASAAKAAELHPKATIVSYESSEPYEEPRVADAEAPKGAEDSAKKAKG